MKQCHQLTREKHFLSVNGRERNCRKLYQTQFHLPLFIKRFSSPAAERIQGSLWAQGLQCVPYLQHGTDQRTS